MLDKRRAIVRWPASPKPEVGQLLPWHLVDYTPQAAWMDDQALVDMEAGFAGPLADDEDVDDEPDLLDLGLPQLEPTAGERLAAFAQQATEAGSPEALQGLSEQAAGVRLEAERATPDVHAPEFGDPFVPGNENLRSGFAELRTTARRFAAAAKTWQLAADHCRPLLEAAHRVGLPAAQTERLEAEVADNAAQAQRQHLLSNLTQAIWQIKQLQLFSTPGHGTAAALLLRQQNLASVLDGALRHARSPALAGRPVLPQPIPAFERELRHIDSALRHLPQRLVEGLAQLRIRDAQRPLLAQAPRAPRPQHEWQPRAQPGASEARSPALIIAERDWQAHLAAEYGGLSAKGLALRHVLQGDGPGPLPMATASLEAGGAAEAAANAEAMSALATQLAQGLALEEHDESAKQPVSNDATATGGAQPAATPAQAIRQPLAPDLSDVLGSMAATHDRLVKGLVRELYAQAPPRGEDARRLAERCARLQSRLLESDVLNAQGDDRYAPARLAAPLAALQQAFEALIPDGTGVPELLDRAEQLARAARAARDIARCTEGDPAAHVQAVAEHCTRLRLDELGQAVVLDWWDAQQTYLRLGESTTRLLDRASDSAHDARDLLFGDPMPDEAPSSATGASLALRGNDDVELMALGNRVAVEAMAAADMRPPFPPDTPAESAGRQKASKIQLQLLSLACKQAAAMVTVLGDAEQTLQHATPAHRARIATQLAERVREDALVSKELFSVVADENNGLEQREVERLRSGLLLNERTAELMRQNLLVLGQLFDARQYALELRQGLASLSEQRLGARLDRLKEKFIQVERAIESAATRLLALNRADPTPVHNVQRSGAMTENSFGELRDRVRNEHNIVTAKIALENLRQSLARIGDGIATPQVLSTLDYYLKSSQAQLKAINEQMLSQMRHSENALKAANVPNAEAFLAPRRRKLDTLLRITIPMRQAFARYDSEFKDLVARSLSSPSTAGGGAAPRVFHMQPPADPPARRPGRQKGGRR